MPLRHYGVLAARAVAKRREGRSDTPHYQLHLTDDAGISYRIAVNVLSQQAPSELLYLADDDFRHPMTEQLPKRGSGWTALTKGLDFIRGNLFDPARMRTLPPDLSGPDNDLADLLDHYVERAIADQEAAVYVYGERWGPEPRTRDKVFGFLPGNGVHDIHMNQGNSGRFASDNGVWQDGGLILHLPSESRYVALFLAFQSQAWHTDDRTGDPIGDRPSRPVAGQEPVRVVAALLDPVRVTLINASPGAIDLAGWKLASGGRAVPLEAGSLAPGVTLVATPALPLSPDGGALTLLDAEGLKVHGVAYTADQARREGWTIVF
ncbi:DUF2278 family protein [Nonomuraea sp. NPDC050556]|uniref:DUF2278 family protein n=1 Tax=Nonomuraea sp. NPDC050556 TaxID=3364369 RepID=UPI0037A0D805